MTKAKSQFVCQQCGTVYPKWVGRCEQCGEWNSLVEQMIESGASVVSKSTKLGKPLVTARLDDLILERGKTRYRTGFADLDMVLGGGILAGGVVLVAGQPGIGKSTLLLQVSSYISRQAKVLYVSGEESAAQVKLRADRLAVSGDQLLEFASATDAANIAATVRSGDYALVIVDSIQTMSVGEITSAPGTVSQITNSANVIIRAAKATDTAVLLVGHVTKEGSIAGPKILEHLVDVVLQFEGDRYGGFKMVRAIKNRYGSTNETAIFEMLEQGLAIVDNPSAVLLAEKRDSDGSVVLATVEGTRPLLVEIQALVNPTNFGYPKRTASGFDLNRLNLLIAVLERRTKLKLSDKDIFLNVVGGMKLADPAADLAVCMAIASVVSGRAVSSKAVVFGEVGLGGEIRRVHSIDKRLSEAKKLGFEVAIAPDSGSHDKLIKPVSDLRKALIDYIK